MAQQTRAGIPDGAYLKDISAKYNHLTIPRELRVFSELPPEMWGWVLVEEGDLDLFVGSGSAKPTRVTPQQPAVIPVDTPFRVAATGRPVRFQIYYYHEPRLTDEDELASLLAQGARERRPAAD